MSDLIPLISPLESLYKDSKYVDGLTYYEALEASTPREDRFGGLCLWSLGKYEEAKIPLYRSIQRGHLDSTLDLIGIHLQLNEFAEAQEWIDLSSKLELSPLNRIEILISESDLYVKLGKSKLAVKALKKAWIQANIVTDPSTSISRVAQSLAVALQSLGEDLKAIEYLNKAITKSSQFWKTILQITLANSLTNSGDLLEAQINLQHTQKDSELNGVVSAYHLIADGQFATVCKKFDQSLSRICNGL